MWSEIIQAAIVGLVCGLMYYAVAMLILIDSEKPDR